MLDCRGAHLNVALPVSKPRERPVLSTGRGQNNASALREEVGQDTARLSAETSVHPAGGGERARMLQWKGLRKANRLRMKKMQERKWSGKWGEVQRKEMWGFRAWVMNKRAVRTYGH